MWQDVGFAVHQTGKESSVQLSQLPDLGPSCSRFLNCEMSLTSLGSPRQQQGGIGYGGCGVGAQTWLQDCLAQVVVVAGTFCTHQIIFYFFILFFYFIIIIFFLGV